MMAEEPKIATGVGISWGAVANSGLVGVRDRPESERASCTEDRPVLCAPSALVKLPGGVLSHSWLHTCEQIIISDPRVQTTVDLRATGLWIPQLARHLWAEIGDPRVQTTVPDLRAKGPWIQSCWLSGCTSVKGNTPVHSWLPTPAAGRYQETGIYQEAVQVRGSGKWALGDGSCVSLRVDLCGKDVSVHSWLHTWLAQWVI